MLVVQSNAAALSIKSIGLRSASSDKKRGDWRKKTQEKERDHFLVDAMAHEAILLAFCPTSVLSDGNVYTLGYRQVLFELIP